MQHSRCTGLLARIFGFLLLSLVLAGCESTEQRIAGHMARAAELVTAGQDEKARLEFANALKLNPDLVAAHLGLAALYERTGRLDAMFGHLNKVVEFEPKNVWALVRLARLTLGGTEIDLARRHAEAAVAASPGDADALSTRAAVSLVLGNREAALADAKKALEIAPRDAFAGSVLVRERAMQNDMAGARKIAEEFLAAHPGDADLNRLLLGTLSALGDLPALGAQLGRMTELEPDNAEYWAALMQWHVETGDPAGAFARLRARAAQPFPDALAERNFADLAGTLSAAMRETAGAEAARAELEALAAAARTPGPYRILLARFDYTSGAPDRAKAGLSDLIAKAATPEEANAARVMLARFLAVEGNQAEAQALAETVLKEDARNSEALALRAAALIDAGNLTGAQTDLRTAMADSPRNPVLLTLSAEVELRLGNRVLAGENLAAAMQAADYAPGETLRYVAFLREGDQAAAAETVLTEAVRQRPGLRELMLPLAELRIQLGKWAEAEAVASEIRALDGDAAADRIRAAALFKQEKFGESLAVLERLAADPAQRDSAMGSLVATYVKAGEPQKAAEFLAGVLKDNPANPQAIYLQGALAETQGDPAAAEARYRALVAARPDLSRSHEILAEFHLRRQDSAAAEAALRTGLAALPGDQALRMRLGGVLEIAGRVDEAIAEYEGLLADVPGSLLLINNIVSLVTDHHANDPERVKRALAIAGPLRGSTVPFFQDTYGWALHVSGDSAAALPILERSTAALASNPWTRYHLGMVLAKLGRAAEARGHLEAALSLAGDAPFPPAETVRKTLEGLPK